MELDFDKYCVVDGSPTTVLPAPPRHSKVPCRKSNAKVKCGNELLNHRKEFAEIGFNRYRSVSCKDIRSRKIVQTGDELLKRGSVYQSSKEVRLQRRPNDVERKKIEFSRGTASTFSFGIIDSLCSLDEESSSAERNGSEQSTSSFCGNQEEFHSRDPLDHSFYPIPERTASLSTSSCCKSKRHDANNQSQGITSSSPYSVAKTNCNNNTQERDAAVSLHKSLSAKLACPHSPDQSDTDGSKASSPRAWQHSFPKMLDLFAKSRAHRNSLNCAKKTVSEPIDQHIGANCKKACTSLLNDLSDKTCHVRNNAQFEKQDNHNSHPTSSPAHIHGLLKVERKHGMLFFEFSVKSPEDVYVAKTSKVDNPLAWAYTFHSLHKRKSNASTWGFKENNKESSVVGQLLVSCYLCTDSKGAGALNDSMVIEFVLYDVAHSRRSISSQDSPCRSPDLSSKPSLVSDEILYWRDGGKNEISGKTKNKVQSKHSSNSGHYESTHPLVAVELHPGLEIAAMVMQVPFEKRESLKFKSEDRQMDKPPLNLLDLCQLEKEADGFSNMASSGKLHVVIPAGNHSLPSSESRGPSSLLDRWRLGGGCDCGGWDMACPLNVCGNRNFQIAEGQPLIDCQHPAELFVQGRKDDAAAFTMKKIEEGKYAVDFHAQLSSLQAFSICVAMLHAGQETSKQTLQSDSLRVFAEEEIKQLIDAVSEEEKLKANKMEDMVPSFLINPPFSPIARV